MLSSSAAFFLGVVPAILVVMWWCIIRESAERRRIRYIKDRLEVERRAEEVVRLIKNAEPGDLIRYEGSDIHPSPLVNMTKIQVAEKFPATPDGCFLCANKYPHRDVGAPGDHLYEFQVEPKLKLYLEWRKDALDMTIDLDALAEKWHAGVPKDPKPWKALLKAWDRHERNMLANYTSLSPLERQCFPKDLVAAMSWRPKGKILNWEYADETAALNREITKQAAESHAFVWVCSKHPKVACTANMPCRSCERDRLAKPYAKGEATLNEILRHYSK